MPRLDRIEKSAFKRGQYVGYAKGVWRITRNGRRWQACREGSGDYLFGDTLTELDRKLGQQA